MARVTVKKGKRPKLPPSYRVTVGLHADAGVHGNANMPIVSLGEIHEFGLGVPQRSFIRGWFDSKQDQIRADVKAFASAPEALALRLAAGCQDYIAAGVAPANAPSTIARKGSSKPLIDTGVLRSSIVGKVEL